MYFITRGSVDVSFRALGRYAFIQAKLRTRIAAMLSQQQVDQLVRCQTLEELFHALRETSYAPLLDLYHESGDVQRLESWLFARNITLHQEVARLMKGVHANAVSAMTRKLEVENLKGVIRLWFSNSVKHQNIDYRFGYLYQNTIVSSIDWMSLVNAEKFEDMYRTLRGTPYEDAVSQWTMKSIVQEGLFGLETALDRTWLHELRETIAHLPSEDRVLADSVLNRDADLKNCINLVRFGWMYRLPETQLRKLMLEGGTLLDTKEFTTYLKTPAEKRSPEQLVVKRFPVLAKRLKESGKTTVEEQVRIVEHYLFTVRRQSFDAILRGNPFTFGIILAYFFLEERQDIMIRSLINGIYYGWDSDTIREFVV